MFWEWKKKQKKKNWTSGFIVRTGREESGFLIVFGLQLLINYIFEPVLISFIHKYLSFVAS